MRWVDEAWNLMEVKLNQIELHIQCNHPVIFYPNNLLEKPYCFNCLFEIKEKELID